VAGQKSDARDRFDRLRERKETQAAAARRADRERRDAVPLQLSRLMEELAPLLPPDTVIVR